ncbi:hypothetical protein EMCRGX_G033265 [Ephydatia muelleri]
MQVLPSSRNASQKFVIGDNDGVLSCFGMRRGDSNVVFKTLPGTKISRVELGRSSGLVSDKIFVAAGSEVKGYSKKGNNFLTLDTNLAESLQSIWVDDANLLVGGSYIYNHYVDCKDTNYYLCSDKINDLLSLPPHTTDPELSPVLACQDCTLRVLRSSNLLYEVEVAGPPSCLALNNGDGGEDGEEVLYGTQNGKLGLVKLQGAEPVYRWDMLNEKKIGGVNCISTYDLTGDGIKDILVGRDDGVLEVYSLDDSDEPRLKYTHLFGESITAVCGGRVGTEKEEVVVSTYSGQVVGLKQDTMGVQQQPDQDVLLKIENLRQEVAGLEARVGGAKEQYHHTLSSATSTDTLSALPQFALNDKFVLNQDECWYTLSIELQVCIECVVLQSSVPVDIQEVDKSTAVISYSPPDPENNNYLLVTLRCHDTNRLEVKVRSIEGQYGVLQAYVTPVLEPKSCRLRQYTIKPLSLHRRIHSFDESRPCNMLKITGPFSFKDQVTLYFKSTFIDTRLECTYRKGEISFRTDNISTVSVLKEVLSKEATQRKVSIKINQDINDASVAHVLKLIHPQLEAQLLLAKNVQLIDALMELKAHEGDTSFLAPQCQFILENAEQMQEELKQQPSMIERLYALITDLYMDRATFKGQNMKHKIPELLSTLESCDLDLLLKFFEGS